ncbi:MAG: S46 family peptidase [Bacteroidia bacterium]|nr:S46 family peptidase [Bacteroidia bacterium]
MKQKSIALIVALLFSFSLFTMADEGMWLPLLLGKNYAEMQKLGLKLTPEQLYDINHSSLKDAIVMLDGGNCTGEVISSNGLILTNHHCGYGDIQAHSSVEHDYLTDGFWAMSKDEELVNPDKTISFLIRIEDVTSKVLEKVNDSMTESERSKAVNEVCNKIETAATKGNDYNAKVSSMFGGNEYYLYVYETYYDVRLVGAPPSSIGKFGGDTDNWMWPRHTGDFSIFRVYCSPDGKPAKYSKDNVPMTPKYVLPISLKGYQQNDFAMIWGFPGSTDRYRSSFGVESTINQVNPVTVKLRDTKMKIMKDYMDKSEKIRIQYAEKYAYLGNFWKKDLEEMKALKRLKVADQKRTIENDFNTWANADPARKEKYGNVISDIEQGYKEKVDNQYDKALWYLIETSFFQGAEILTFSFEYAGLIDSLKGKKINPDYIKSLRTEASEHFKNYNAEIDEKILVAMFSMFSTDVTPNLQPDIFAFIKKKFDGDFKEYAENLFKKSIFSSEEKLNKFLDKPKLKKLQNDPAYKAMNSLYGCFFNMNMLQGKSNTKMQKAKRLFIAGLREMNSTVNYYPDANSTMRVTYGKVLAYDPRDAVHYDYMTDLAGVMEKEDATNDEFIVPAKLKEIYEKKDYGDYGKGNKMPVCFLTDNDITGGNSGSPVINGNGELIGAAFDGNSEALSSDIKFDPPLQRTIVVDIRYILLIIDKYAGAKNLISEMKIVK